jgi:hypothetical protein
MHEALCKILKILSGCQWRGKSTEHLMEGDPAKLPSLMQGYINLFTHVCNQFHNKEDITHNTYAHSCLRMPYGCDVICQVSFAPYKSNFSDWAARGAWRPCLQLLQLPWPFQCLWQTTILTRVQLVCIHLMSPQFTVCRRTISKRMNPLQAQKKREMFRLSRAHISIATPLIAGIKDSNGYLGMQFWL